MFFTAIILFAACLLGPTTVIAIPTWKTKTSAITTAYSAPLSTGIITSIPYKFYIVLDAGQYIRFLCNAVFSFNDGTFLQHQSKMNGYLQPTGNVASVDQITVKFSIHAVSLDEYKEAKCKLHPRSTFKIYTADQYATITSSDGKLCLTSTWFQPCERLNDPRLSTESRAQRRVSSILRLASVDSFGENNIETYSCKKHREMLGVDAVRDGYVGELQKQIANTRAKEHYDCANCGDPVQHSNIFKVYHQLKYGRGGEMENCVLS
jgi:hypothetical protein